MKTQRDRVHAPTQMWLPSRARFGPCHRAHRRPGPGGELCPRHGWHDHRSIGFLRLESAFLGEHQPASPGRGTRQGIRGLVVSPAAQTRS